MADLAPVPRFSVAHVFDHDLARAAPRKIDSNPQFVAESGVGQPKTNRIPARIERWRQPERCRPCAVLPSLRIDRSGSKTSHFQAQVRGPNFPVGNRPEDTLEILFGFAARKAVAQRPRVRYEQ